MSSHGSWQVNEPGICGGRHDDFRHAVDLHCDFLIHFILARSSGNLWQERNRGQHRERLSTQDEFSYLPHSCVCMRSADRESVQFSWSVQCLHARVHAEILSF